MRSFDLNYTYSLGANEVEWIPSIVILKAFIIQSRDKTGNGPYTHVYTWQEYLDGATDHCFYSGILNDHNTDRFPYGRLINEKQRILGREAYYIT